MANASGFAVVFFCRALASRSCDTLHCHPRAPCQVSFVSDARACTPSAAGHAWRNWRPRTTLRPAQTHVSPDSSISLDAIADGTDLDATADGTDLCGDRASTRAPFTAAALVHRAQASWIASSVFNAEADVGDPGLRDSKRSYKPLEQIHKWIITAGSPAHVHAERAAGYPLAQDSTQGDTAPPLSPATSLAAEAALNARRGAASGRGPSTATRTHRLEAPQPASAAPGAPARAPADPSLLPKLLKLQAEAAAELDALERSAAPLSVRQCRRCVVLRRSVRRLAQNHAALAGLMATAH